MAGEMVWSLWANYVSLAAGFVLFALGMESAAFPLGTFESIRPTLDVLFKPAPIIQITLVIFIMAIEWPLAGVRGTLGPIATDYRVRVVVYTIVGTAAVFVNQTVNPGIYLLIAAGAYVKAVMNGERDMKLPRSENPGSVGLEGGGEPWGTYVRAEREDACQWRPKSPS
ncbi:MAG: hypothetical protein BJ554DRAFT_1842, partial [Olpidium bornovanus]